MVTQHGRKGQSLASDRGPCCDLFADYNGVVYEMGEGGRIVEALGHRKAVIL